ncbi:MAG: hypothetical protein AAGM38_02010 [Pseudomonadota bacterium]
MRAWLCGVLAVALGGCAHSLPDRGAPIAVTPNDPAVIGLDVYGPERALTPDAPAYLGASTVQLRSFIDPPGVANRKETSSVCEVTGGVLFRATVETPAKIVVPNYGERSLRLSAKCTGDGKRGQGAVEVFNRREREFQEGLDALRKRTELGAAVTAIVLARRLADRETLEYEYPSLTVTLE